VQGPRPPLAYLMTRFVRVLNSLEEWTLVLILLGLALVSFVQVICRYLFGFSFTWMEEVGRHVSIFIAFLGAAIGVKYGTHFSMDLMYERVQNDRFRHFLKIVINIISGLILFVVAWYGWQQTMKLQQFGVLTPVLKLPKYWAYLPIPIFSIIMGIRFFSLARSHLIKLIRGEPFTADTGRK
jgi:C4-dicarboxylate transporter, DctQ subunit